VLIVAEIELAVNIARGAIEVNLNSYSLVAVAVEGFIDRRCFHTSTTDIVMFIPDNVHPGIDVTALFVGEHSDVEFEGPSCAVDCPGLVKTEVDNLHLAVDIIVGDISSCFLRFILNSIRCSPVHCCGFSVSCRHKH